MLRKILGWIALFLATPIIITAVIGLTAITHGTFSADELIRNTLETFGVFAALHLLALAVLLPIFGIGTALAHKWRWADRFFTGALFGGAPLAIGWDWLTSHQVPSWLLALGVLGCGAGWASVDATWRKCDRDETHT